MQLTRLIALLSLLAAGFLFPTRADAAPTYQDWTPPDNLFETEGRASEAEVVADPSGAVHVFWAYGAPDAEDEGWGQAIYYARLQDGAWSEPVDVLISPGGRTARMHSVAVDGDGYLHVVWSGGSALFYSSAHATDAGAAMSWTPPQTLVSGVAALEPALAVGPDGALNVVWSQAGAGLVFARSYDGGRSWSTPQVIYQADRENELVRWGRIAVDEGGRIHVALTYTVDDPAATYGRTNANLLYYLQSDDRGATWSEPFLVTPEPDFGEINVVTFGANTVHLMWNGRIGRNGRYHRWSQDGGATWSDIGEVVAPAPASPIGDAGLTGFPALATDATGALHMVTTANQGNFYLRWQDGVWSPPVLISPGLDGLGVTGQSSTLEQPSIAISQGNQLHVVFHDGFERIWHTGRQIDASYQPPQAIPTPGGASTVAPAASPTAVATDGSARVLARPLATLAPLPTSGPSYLPILISVLPAVVLVGIVLLVYGFRRRR